MSPESRRMPHLRDAQRPQHLVERADGVRHAGLAGVVGVDEQDGVRRVRLAVGAEGVILGVEHLHPGVGHRAAGVHAVELVGDRAGGAGAAADVGSARAEDGSVRALRAAGAELQHRRPWPRGRCGWPWWRSGSGGSRQAADTFPRAAPRWRARAPSTIGSRGKTGVPSGTA